MYQLYSFLDWEVLLRINHTLDTFLWEYCSVQASIEYIQEATTDPECSDTKTYNTPNMSL